MILSNRSHWNQFLQTYLCLRSIFICKSYGILHISTHIISFPTIVRMSLFIHGNAIAHVNFQPSLVVCMSNYPPCSQATPKALQQAITNTIKSNFVISLSVPHTSSLSKYIQVSNRVSLSHALGSTSISQKDSNINTSSIL